ncbi:MAG: hypothetical protein ABH811_02895 [archaeon]
MVKKQKSKSDKYFLLTWRKLWVLVVVGFVSILLHNLFYGIFNIEEPLFFSLVVFVLPLYFIICIIYSTIKIIKNRRK